MKLFLLVSLLVTSLISTSTFAMEIPNLWFFGLSDDESYGSDDDFSGNNNQTIHPTPQANVQQINIPDFGLEDSDEESANNRGMGA